MILSLVDFDYLVTSERLRVVLLSDFDRDVEFNWPPVLMRFW